MDYRSLSSLLLRLAGVLILVAAVSAVPSTFIGLLGTKSGTADVELLLIAAVATAFPVLVGLLLLYFPATVANKLLSGQSDRELDVSELQQLAFSVLVSTSWPSAFSMHFSG